MQGVPGRAGGATAGQEQHSKHRLSACSNRYNHKVLILYTVPRVPQEYGPSPPHVPQASVPSPPEPKGGGGGSHTRLRVMGGGGSPNSNY